MSCARPMSEEAVRRPDYGRSASVLIRASVLCMPRSRSASSPALPPRNIRTKVCDSLDVPFGAARRSVTRVPDSVGSSSYDHTVLFSKMRNAIRFSGTKSTTLALVGHTAIPLRLRLSVLVPTRTSPNTNILRHCGLHSPIRARSETIDHTLSTGASTSVDNSSTSLNVVSAIVLLGAGARIDALTYCRYPNRMGNATYVTPWAQYSSLAHRNAPPNEDLPSAVPSRPK